MEEIQSAQSTEQIALVQLARFQKQLPMNLFGQSVSAIVIAFLASNPLNTKEVILWLSAFFAILSVRAIMYAYQSVNPNTVQNRPIRVCGHFITVALTGLLWGGLAFSTIDENRQFETMIVVMILLGLVTSAIGRSSHLRPFFHIFSLLIIIPVVIKLVSFNQSQYTLLACLILFYFIIAAHFEKQVHETLTESIQLRFKNLNLIDNLTEEKLRAQDSQHNAEQSLGVAEKANIAKSRFLAAASHDLRQPLHALRLLNSTLKSTQLDAQQEPLVEHISSSVNSLEELLNSLLDISKFDSGTQTVDRSTVYLSDIFLNLQRDYASVSAEKGIQFIVEETNQVIKTDVILLERLLSNLISNAVRYTREGTIELSTSQVKGQCVIKISDTGFGMSEEDQGRVFDEFVQLENPERDRTKGIGLGLSIVKRTADLLELPLTLESTLGKGTTFTVAVPLGDSKDLNEIDLTEPANVQNLENMLILAVDDEISVRVALEGLLDSWGCLSLLAGDGVEAEQIVREINTKPDAIIADLRLRDNETGVDVIDRINGLFESKCPAIILTGEIDSTSLKELQSTQFPILHKPCDPDVLFNHLTSIKPEKTTAVRLKNNRQKSI